MCLPGSNAFVERIFSLLKIQLSDERNRLCDDALETLVYIIANATSMSIDCKEAYNIFSGDKEMLKEVISKAKYNRK